MNDTDTLPPVIPENTFNRLLPLLSTEFQYTPSRLNPFGLVVPLVAPPPKLNCENIVLPVDGELYGKTTNVNG